MIDLVYVNMHSTTIERIVEQSLAACAWAIESHSRFALGQHLALEGFEPIDDAMKFWVAGTPDARSRHPDEIMVIVRRSAADQHAMVAVAITEMKILKFRS